MSQTSPLIDDSVLKDVRKFPQLRSMALHAASPLAECSILDQHDEAERLQRHRRIYEQWSDPEAELELLPSLTEDDLFDAVAAEFKDHCRHCLDDLLIESMTQYDHTALAQNIAAFEADLLECQPFHWLPHRWGYFDRKPLAVRYFEMKQNVANHIILGQCGTNRLEYMTCGVGLSALFSLKQQAATSSCLYCL